MPLTHSVPAGSLTVMVRELTVRETRDWATSVEQGLIEVDPIAFLALEGTSLQDMEFMTDKTMAELETLAPSDLEEVAAVCRKLNPHFFRLRSGMTGAALLMQEEARRVTSSGPASR